MATQCVSESLGRRTCVDMPAGAFVASGRSCPTGYNYAEIGGTRHTPNFGSGPGMLGVCIPAPAPAPAPVQSAPANITVSPNIQTQVSPQVSPVFQQQYQPTNSPMSASTQQNAAELDAIKAQAAAWEKAAREAAAREAAIAARPPQAAVPVAPEYRAPVEYGGNAPVAAPVSMPPQAGVPVSVPQYSVTDEQTPTVPSSAVATQTFDWKTILMIGAGALGIGLLLSGNKR